MADVSKSNELLEVYKLQSELADRVSQRREGANRLYAGLLTGLTTAIGALLRFGDDGQGESGLIVGCVLGIALSISWWIVIRSYRQLNTGKFAALHELEDQLAYPFFKREWDLLSKGKDYRRYWRLSVVEVGLPLIFVALFLTVLVWSVWMR